MKVNVKRAVLVSVFILSSVCILYALLATGYRSKPEEVAVCCKNPNPHHVCVMKTILGIDTSGDGKAISTFKTTPMVEKALRKGLEWMISAQSPDGGWGSGTHTRQDILDPHAVQTDPASTALVAMALLRTDNTLNTGRYSNQLRKATENLLKIVEDCPANQTFLTTVTNTQPQIKLGRNIDVILTSQFLSNLLRYEIKDAGMKRRIEQALDKCVARIQSGQDNDGSWKDGGWAPVLQSALANNALEEAGDIGRKVDQRILDRSREYQNGNFDATTKTVSTDRAAGVMLYSLSGTARGSAKNAKKAEDIVTKAYKEGKIKTSDIVSEKNLLDAGISAPEAKELVTAYEINKASRNEAMRDDVMMGFGNNGGEEFLSFLMTGESMMMQGGNEWKKWYDMMTGKLINIQNNDGSWNGHHCITSPVFCTATCLLILSIHNDLQFSIKMHKDKKGF